VDTYDLAEAAARIGVRVDELSRLCELGIITPDDGGRFTPGHLRRAGLVDSLVTSGIPLDGLAQAISGGRISLDFLDAPAFQRFSVLSGDTFAEVAARTGVPVEQLLFIREAAGSLAPSPDDRIREEELPIAEFVSATVGAGLPAESFNQVLRVQGDSLRRLAETESAWWQAEVIMPALEAGKNPAEFLGDELSTRMSMLSEQSVIAMLHLQQTRAWTGHLIEGLEIGLAAAGLHTRTDRPPAMCFLDISGYTRLTQERGDAAAAQVAERLGRIVQRISVNYGGRAVKWLGDGVMLHFPDPPQGVVAALEMVDGVVAAGLPPAHIGLHAGPVIFQEGDYYGSTVNVAARIAAYAQAGEVMVSQDVVDASAGAALAFRDVGPVELKGVSGAMHLHAASRLA
jgi:adenylate cyclase